MQPPPPLAAFVREVWDWRAEMRPVFALERVLPTPAASVIINLAEDETRAYASPDPASCERRAAAVFGAPRSRSQIIDTHEQVAVLGITFQPGGAAAFLHERMDGLCDRELPLEALFGLTASSLRERLQDSGTARERVALVLQYLWVRMPRDPVAPVVQAALQAIDAAPQWARVDTLVRRSGLGARRFGQLFREQVGLGPKRYARLCRFRHLIEQVHAQRRVRWADVALDAGLCDQAHLVREFSAFAGLSPSDYLARVGVHPNHVPL